MIEKDSLFEDVEFIFSCAQGKIDLVHSIDQILSQTTSERICGGYEQYVTD